MPGNAGVASAPLPPRRFIDFFFLDVFLFLKDFLFLDVFFLDFLLEVFFRREVLLDTRFERDVRRLDERFRFCLLFLRITIYLYYIVIF
mgnify:CR=1 FL=1